MQTKKCMSYNYMNYFKILPSPKLANCSCFYTTTISLLALHPALCPVCPFTGASWSSVKWEVVQICAIQVYSVLHRYSCGHPKSAYFADPFLQVRNSSGYLSECRISFLASLWWDLYELIAHFQQFFRFCPPKIGHPPKFAPKISKELPNTSF